jgi:hypothetical protein
MVFRKANRQDRGLVYEVGMEFGLAEPGGRCMQGRFG